jgi:hypothetical protein
VELTGTTPVIAAAQPLGETQRLGPDAGLRWD